ncbi:MAG TPA: tetratricopeptide repeat protein, partial [Polyangiaceae bacterium]|nr:tetratricopeptide repeat protein [Polyangiaceae bacterium]
LAAPASSAAPSEMLTLPAPAAPAAASSAGAAAPRATTPAALLVAANLARRQGRTGEARELYRVIVERHPAAREAPVARLALAKLLAPATPAAALAEFEALATSGGALRAEGLWGQAECARRLGRAAVERRALEALLREYPASAYADAARERIAHGGR